MTFPQSPALINTADACPVLTLFSLIATTSSCKEHIYMDCNPEPPDKQGISSISRSLIKLQEHICFFMNGTIFIYGRSGTQISFVNHLIDHMMTF